MHQAQPLDTEDKAVNKQTGIPAFMPKGVRQVKYNLDDDEVPWPKSKQGRALGNGRVGTGHFPDIS